LAGAPADLATLVALHRAHVERVPYESLQIALGRPPDADSASSVASVLRGHGGYCFHLNGAFSWLLSALGYAVHHHRAGVQGARDPEPVGANGNHLALTVELVGHTWLVDVGLGSALHEPVPLVEGRYRQGPFDYGIRPSEVVPGGWRFDHDLLADSFVGMDLDLAPCSLGEATTRHTELSTSPASMFVKVLAVQRRDASGVDLLRWTWLVRIDESGWHERVLTSADELAEVCRSVFGLSLDGIKEPEWEALYAGQAAGWERARARRSAR
jgi:arylamine N-acetyltransferase